MLILIITECHDILINLTKKSLFTILEVHKINVTLEYNFIQGVTVTVVHG